MRAPLMLDVGDTALTAEDRELLRHPSVGGVVLFARNYASPAQLRELTGSIHSLCDPPLIIAVDQEGGRVQRFVDGFTRIPAMGRIGAVEGLVVAGELAHAAGVVIATELARCGVDLSFTPVLDLDLVSSEVIGARALGADPERVATLALRVIAGLNGAGMPAVGKHFPGHGSVRVDSHVAVPVDDRHLQDVEGRDLVPFRRAIDAGLSGVMSAHVQFPNVTPEPATFAPFWLTRVLRDLLGFSGLAFSDDLSMGAARQLADPCERVATALHAGCDVALLCNDRAAAVAVLDGLAPQPTPVLAARAARFWAAGGARAVSDGCYRQAQARLQALAGSRP